MTNELTNHLQAAYLAGVRSLWVSIGERGGFALAHVSADASNPPELVKQFSTQSFVIGAAFVQPTREEVEAEVLDEAHMAEQERKLIKRMNELREQEGKQ